MVEIEKQIHLNVQSKRKVSVLGATGSIGSSVRSVILQKPMEFEVEALVSGVDASGLATLAIELEAKFAVIADESRYQELKSRLHGTGIEAAAGSSAVIEAATRTVDVVVSAITGIAGLASTYAAAASGQTIALANKEALVCAGNMLMNKAQLAGATILPLDSEHNALFQALNGNSVNLVESMVLTASGGPFMDWDSAQIQNATKEQALAHPNWNMGQKISIDSASFMNKGLELIEAHYLFNIPVSRLKVLVHPQSIVHGLIIYQDGSVIAGMALPDMRVPIAHCLAWPQRLNIDLPRLNLASIGTMSFFEPDYTRFPCLGLAKSALAEGGPMPTVLNGANEVAVEAFLKGFISFGGISILVENTMNAYRQCESHNLTPVSLQDVYSVNLVSKQLAETGLSKASSRAIH